MTVVPLHNHSEYSALDGLSTVKEIADRCEELGCPCCGLSDHGTVAGHLQFGAELEKRGIKPIYACELYHGVKTKFQKQERDQAHFIVGARTDEGLRNLWRLADAASSNFRFVGRVTWEMLEKHSEGLFATSACLAGLVAQGIRDNDLNALDRYCEIYKSNFYVEIHTYPSAEQEQINTELVRIARERGLPLVYANDAHFASPSQYKLHDLYTTMQVGDTISTPLQDRKMWHPMALYIMEEYDIRQHLNYLPEDAVDEAIANSRLIGEQCNARLPEVRRHLPKFVPKESPYANLDATLSDPPATTWFLDLVEQGLKDRYGEDAPNEVWDRAAFELEALLKEGLEHYFLQAWDFGQFCDDKDIARGPGRGSSAGSIVAYALRITDVDPLKYGLYFERFWNPGRAKGFPDIDTDFPQAQRGAVKAYLAERWGQDNVRAIGTVKRMKPKSACDSKAYKACEITWEEKDAVKKIVSTVPDIDILDSKAVGWSRELDPGKTIYVKETVGRQIEKWIEDQPQERQPHLKQWVEILELITNRVSGYGVHASGVVVSDVPLADELPCFYSASAGSVATMFPMEAVEKRGFVKQDILGLRTIDTLEDWRKQVSNYNINVKWSGLENGEHPEEMWKLLDDGLTLGIFQIEGGFASGLCQQFKPRSIEDLSIIVALNRPGPKRSGAPESFVARRKGDEPIAYDHPILENVLNETYGWFLYQEQVIAFFDKLGYTKSEADAVRKILGKKLDSEMEKLYKGEGDWEGRGYREMAEKAGLYPGISSLLHAWEKPGEIIWNKLRDFALYSFNKAHAVAYAVLAFRTLYAKYNAPSEFIMACIRTNPEDAGDYVREGSRMGVKVLPPDILKSGEDIGLVDRDIYFGLSNVKGIGIGTARYITTLRQTYDLSTRENFDSALAIEMTKWEKNGKKGRSPKQSCRSNVIDVLERVGAFDNYSDRNVTTREIQNSERELLGVILTDTCEEAFQNNSDLIDECDSYDDLLNPSLENSSRVPGIITKVMETETRTGKSPGQKMGIVNIEYGTQSVTFAVFPRQWMAYKFLWSERTPGIFTIKRSERGLHFEDGMAL